jgi:hypothetical protein
MERFFARTKSMLDKGSGDELDGGETERFRLQIAAFRQGLERL